MNNVSQTNYNGVGFLGLLAILFIGLKLTGYITWPWIWVLAPLWGGLILWFIFFVITLIVLLVAFLLSK